MRTNLIRGVLALAVVFAVSAPALAQSIVRGKVLDAQGNRTTVNVRFWVAAPDFRILSLVAPVSRPAELQMRFENPDARTDHTVLQADTLEASFNAWSPLPLLGWEAESNRVRRVEVQLPSGQSTSFLRVRQP